MDGAYVMRFNTSWGSNPPHLQVGDLESLQIRCVCRERGVTIDLFCSFICYRDAASKVIARFLARFVPMIFPYIELEVASLNDWCTLALHSGISVMNRVKINEQNRSIVAGPLYMYVHTEFERSYLKMWWFYPKLY